MNGAERLPDLEPGVRTWFRSVGCCFRYDLPRALVLQVLGAEQTYSRRRLCLKGDGIGREGDTLKYPRAENSKDILTWT